jgi:hypothetical protein
MIDLKRFWDLIAFARNRPAEDHFEALRSELMKLPPDEILAFELRYDEREHAAYKEDLWGAAYLIEGGCSDDGFHDFRAWLVAQGRQVYDNAVANPDSLADVLDGEEVDDDSGLDSAAWSAWQGATGRSEDDYYRELEQAQPPWTEPDMGEDWDFDDDDEVRRRLPRLAKLYLDPDEE